MRPLSRATPLAAMLAVLALAAWPASVRAQGPAPHAGSPGAAAEQTAPPQRDRRRATSVRLSNERTLSRWAHPARLADVYSGHSARSRRVGRLRFFTEDGFPEVYLLLSQWTSSEGKEWVKMRVPKRPNGRVGWVPREALGPFHVVRTQLIVNRRTLRAVLYKRGKRIWSARVGVGKAGTATPRGKFWIREKFRFKSTPVYGTHALGTGAYAPTLSDWPNGGVVGLHGTNQPELIPGRPSHGCIRIRNADIARLYRRIPVGTPLLIK